MLNFEKQHLTQRAKLSILIVVGIVLICLVYIRFLNTSNYNYTYTKLNTYQIPGFEKGSGMSFDKPVELEEVAKLPQTKDNQMFVHNKTLKNKKEVTLSYEAAAAIYNYTGSDYDKQIKDLTDKALINSSDKSHAQYVKALHDYAANIINKRYSIKITSVSRLKTPNLSTYAWSATFSGKDSKPKSYQTPKDISGEVVMAIGKGGYYYFLAGSVGDNWNKNQKTWQSVIDSIKIDQ